MRGSVGDPPRRRPARNSAGDSSPAHASAAASAETEAPVDARLAACALAAWLSCALGLGVRPLVALAGAAVLLLAGLLCLPRVDPRLVVVMLAAGAGLLVAGLRLGVSDSGPVPALAEQRAVVEANLRSPAIPGW